MGIIAQKIADRRQSRNNKTIQQKIGLLTIMEKGTRFPSGAKNLT